MKKLLFASILLLIFMLSSCGNNAPKADPTGEITFIQVGKDSIVVDVIVTDADGAINGEVKAYLTDSSGVVIEGKEKVITVGENHEITFSSLILKKEYRIVLGYDKNGVMTEFASDVFTTNQPKVTKITSDYSNGVERGTEFTVDIHFTNPENHEITQIRFGDQVVSKHQFVEGSTNEIVKITVMAGDEIGIENHRLLSFMYNDGINSSDSFVTVSSNGLISMPINKRTPVILDIYVENKVADRGGEVSIAVLIDENDELTEIKSLYVDGEEIEEFQYPVYPRICTKWVDLETNERIETPETSDCVDELDEDMLRSHRKFVFVTRIPKDVEVGSTYTVTINDLFYNDYDFGPDKAFDLSEFDLTFDVKVESIGEGTENNPIRISYIEDLQRIGRSEAWGFHKWFSIQNDLDFNDPASYKNPDSTEFGDLNGNGIVEGMLVESTTGKGWQPIGYFDDERYITGGIIGNGNTISNLYINRPGGSCIAFICAIGESGEIRKINLENATIIAQSGAGLVGENLGGTIKSVYLNNIHITSDAGVDRNGTGTSYIGGLVGFHYGNVNKVYGENIVIRTAGCDVDNKFDYQTQYDELGECRPIGYGYFGGLIGKSNGGLTDVSYADADIYVVGNTNVQAGIIMGDQSGGKLYESYAFGTVHAVTFGTVAAGGVVGGNLGGEIMNVIALSDVHAQAQEYFNHGALVETIQSVGGIAGHNVSMGFIGHSISVDQHIIMTASLLNSYGRTFYNAISGMEMTGWGSSAGNFRYGSVLEITASEDKYRTLDQGAKVDWYDLINPEWYSYYGNRLENEDYNYERSIIPYRTDFDPIFWDFSKVSEGYFPELRYIEDAIGKRTIIEIPRIDLEGNVIDLSVADIENTIEMPIATFSNQTIEFNEEMNGGEIDTDDIPEDVYGNISVDVTLHITQEMIDALPSTGRFVARLYEVTNTTWEADEDGYINPTAGRYNEYQQVEGVDDIVLFNFEDLVSGEMEATISYSGLDARKVYMIRIIDQEAYDFIASGNIPGFINENIDEGNYGLKRPSIIGVKRFVEFWELYDFVK